MKDKPQVFIHTDRRKLKRYKRKYKSYVTFRVRHHDPDTDYRTMGQWCCDNFGYCMIWMEVPNDKRYHRWFLEEIILEDYFFFRNHSDAVMFKLSWE